MKKVDRIVPAHGNGGRMMHELIDGLFLKYFKSPLQGDQPDAAVFGPVEGRLAFTTDTFVVDPVFFPGGNIGNLAICGTVNDLAVTGAEPLWLSAAFILEEGFLLSELETIVATMAEEAEKAGVSIVTGDTKVVPKGKCDKVFINTAGVGRIVGNYNQIEGVKNVRPGDAILINGTVGDHGMAVLGAREAFRFRSPVVSDCAPLNGLIADVLSACPSVRFMRDPTRGGLATVLNELAEKCGMGILVDEADVPVSRGVTALCEMLGFDPLQIANEGKVLVVTSSGDAELALKAMRSHPLGREAAIIGHITEEFPRKVVLRTETGGKRLVEMLTGDPLPRIC